MTDPAPATTPEPSAPETAVPPIPETYKFNLPEGLTYDTSAVASKARALKLTQEAAQALCDVEVSHHAKTMTDWKAELTAHSTLGGANLQKTMDTAKRGVDQIAKSMPEIRDFLASTRLEHNPKIIALFHHIGLAAADDKLVTGGAKTTVSTGERLSQATRDHVEKLFPSKG